LCELRGDYPAASSAFEEARRTDPTNVEYVVASVECLASLDRVTEAWALLEESNSQRNDDGSLMALRAHLRSLGIQEPDHGLTVSSFRQAIEGSRVLAEEVGRRLAEQGRCREALAVLGPLVTANREPEPTGSVLRAAAACHLAMNNPSAATAVLGEFAQANPEDTLAQLLVAKAALANDDMTAALRAIDLVQQREPHRPDLWLLRAAVHWKRGNLTAAANDLFDVLRDDPTDVEAHCLLGEVYQAQERRDAARDQFRQALAIDPECSWASAAVRKLESGPIPGAGERPEAKLTAIPEMGKTPAGQP
jgi:Flp pilus assembly protein TadD